LQKRRDKKKNMTFFFEINVATQGVSFQYFHVYMCYTPNYFIFSNYLHSSWVHFLWWFQPG
jgi:hypothetical protein